MAREKRSKIPLDDGGTVSIGEALGMSTAQDAAPAPQAPKTSGWGGGRAYDRAIIRRETSGRGGKAVTSIDLRPRPTADEAEELARKMRRALGCGSRVEHGREGLLVILTGDIRDRAAEWLTKNGSAKSITTG